MAKLPRFEKEAERLKYVIDQFRLQHVSPRALSLAVGFHPSELATIMKRLANGQNVSVDKWKAIREATHIDHRWWLSGEGASNLRAEERRDEILRLAKENDLKFKPGTRSGVRVGTSSSAARRISADQIEAARKGKK